MDWDREKNYKVGEKDPNGIITCSNCRHGMGVPNGNPIWRCDWGAVFGTRWKDGWVGERKKYWQEQYNRNERNEITVIERRNRKLLETSTRMEEAPDKRLPIALWRMFLCPHWQIVPSWTDGMNCMHPSLHPPLSPTGPQQQQSSITSKQYIYCRFNQVVDTQTLSLVITLGKEENHTTSIWMPPNSLQIFLGREEGKNEKMNGESKYLIVVDGMHCEKEVM